jgi:hypothetical protein
MPLSWSAFVHAQWKTRIQQLAGRSFSKESEYIEWLGRRVTVFNEVGSNLIVVSENMLKELVRNLR